MTSHLTQHAIVPVANQKDARITAQILESYEFEWITVLHVVEKGEGVPDKIPVEQSEEVADEIGASAVVFRPRRATRPIKWLAGDRSLQLLIEADRPVISISERGNK